mmetsp:Transcript_4071/g.13262  ORF Transcript_4071/g.13262 Transcript_4071/m.13262 type:complete len:221 (-) Transcript_4071:1028-1690(-)
MPTVCTLSTSCTVTSSLSLLRLCPRTRHARPMTRNNLVSSCRTRSVRRRSRCCGGRLARGGRACAPPTRALPPSTLRQTRRASSLPSGLRTRRRKRVPATTLLPTCPTGRSPASPRALVAQRTLSSSRRTRRSSSSLPTIRSLDPSRRPSASTMCVGQWKTRRPLPAPGGCQSRGPSRRRTSMWSAPAGCRRRPPTLPARCTTPLPAVLPLPPFRVLCVP